MAQQIKTRDLRLADVVQFNEGAFTTCTVTQIKDGLIHLFRPYVHTADYSYTGGVIPYIGIEAFTVFEDSDSLVTVLSRKELR